MAKAKQMVMPSNSSKILVLIIVLVGVALYLGLTAGTLGEKRANDFRNELVQDDGTQAVHLADGRIYFGDIGFRGDSVVIDSAYYVKDVDTETTKASLSRHGSEAYGPSGTIVVNSNQVLFWENLRDNSIVTQTIRDNKPGDKN